MMGIAHTQGLLKELEPKFLEVQRLESCLKRAIASFTNDELVNTRTEVESIKFMICHSISFKDFGICTDRISDLILTTLARRRGVKQINHYNE
jgi:hypothetical protein